MINPLLSLKIFVGLLAISSLLAGSQVSCSEASPPLIEAKAGYFMFSDSKMHKIYDKGGLDIQLCASYPVWNLTPRWTLNAYGAVEYFQRSGQSLNDNQKTSLWSIPVNIGLKPVYALNAYMHYYFTIGPRYLFVHQHNQSPYIYRGKSGSGVGYFVNTGITRILCNALVFDIFGEYSHAKTHFRSRESGVYVKNTQVGGFTVGGALGYSF